MSYLKKKEEKSFFLFFPLYRDNESLVHGLMHRTRGIALREALLLSFMYVFTALAEGRHYRGR